MSYLTAKEQFEDARRLIGPPTADNLHFAILLDINNALENMMDAMRSDLSRIESKLDAIQQSQQRSR